MEIKSYVPLNYKIFLFFHIKSIKALGLILDYHIGNSEVAVTFLY